METNTTISIKPFRKEEVIMTSKYVYFMLLKRH